MQLEMEMTYRVTTRGPLAGTEGSPLGTRQLWEMSDATLSGKRIQAKLSMPGMDWMQVSSDDFWRPDVRVPFVTGDGADILLHYTGLVEKTEKFVKAAEGNHATGWDDQYMRMVMRFDTGAKRYAWLNQHLFIARGKLLGTYEIEYEVFRVL